MTKRNVFGFHFVLFCLFLKSKIASSGRTLPAYAVPLYIRKKDSSSGQAQPNVGARIGSLCNLCAKKRALLPPNGFSPQSWHMACQGEWRLGFIHPCIGILEQFAKCTNSGLGMKTYHSCMVQVTMSKIPALGLLRLFIQLLTSRWGWGRDRYRSRTYICLWCQVNTFKK